MSYLSEILSNRSRRNAWLSLILIEYISGTLLSAAGINPIEKPAAFIVMATASSICATCLLWKRL